MMRISTLAWKNIRQNKSIILMIALAAMLCCSVINLGFSAQRSMIENVTATAGDNHARFAEVTDEQIERISQHKDVERVDMHLVSDVRGVPANGKKAEVDVLYSSGLSQVAGFKLTSGRPPEAENEAVIPPHVAELLGIEPIVGVEFDMVFRTPDGEEAIQRFTVSGILQQQRMFAAMNVYEMFTSKPFVERFDCGRQLYVRIKGGYLVDKALAVAEDAGVPRDDVHFNEQYLSVNAQDSGVFAFVAVVLLILCAAGVLVIFNAYNLSVVKKIHQYGLLTVLGASQRQIRRCVYAEALYSSILGLPFGLLAGTFLGYWGMTVLNQLMYIPMGYAVTPVAYVCAAIVTLATVYIGVRRPARKASLIAPVEAVRFADAAETVYKRETVENVTINALVKINMTRAKKRTLGTVLSLSVSGIMFLGFSTVAFSTLDSAGSLARQMIPGDMIVTAGNLGITQKPDPLTRELTDTIRGLNGVTDITPVSITNITHNVTDSRGGDILYRGGIVVGIPDDRLQAFIDKTYGGSPTFADLSVPGNVIAVMPSSERTKEFDRDQPRYRIYDTLKEYYVGSTLVCTYYDHTGRGSEDTVALTIVGLLHEEDIREYSSRASYVPRVYMPFDNLAVLGIDDTYETAVLDIDDAKHDALYAAVEQLCADDPELSVQSYKRVKDELSQQITGIIAVVFLMLGVIALNGVMNLISATFMGVEQRKKELGVLMAVGLSRKGIGKLLIREGVWMSVFCTLLSATVGLALGVGLYRLLIYIGADYLHFVFPVWPLVSLCVAMLIVPFGITMTAVRRLRRFTTVELLGRQT